MPRQDHAEVDATVKAQNLIVVDDSSIGSLHLGAGEAVARILEVAGIRRIYTVPGESFLEILDAAEQSRDLTLVSTRHESGAAFMAEADAKLTGVPAVVIATRGVGAANLAIGVHTAMQDCTPMVVLVGQVETLYAHNEAFQEVDLAAFYRPITKWVGTVNRARRLPDLLAKAIVVATTGRPGPVMLALPADLLRRTIPAEVVSYAARIVASPHAPATATEETIRAIAKRIDGARRPVIIAGGGIRSAHVELVRSAEKFGLGVYSSFRRQDVFPNDHRNYLGHLTLGTPQSCLRALAEADVVLVLGARLDEVTTQTYNMPSRDAEIIHVDVDVTTARDGVFASWSVNAEADDFVRQFAGLESASPHRDWSAAHAAYLQASIPERRSSVSGMDPAEVIAVMTSVLPSDSIVTNDAGNFSTFLHLYWRFQEPHRQVAPGSGAMGYGVPSGIASALASPGRTTVAVCGDGGFLMTGQEIETAVRLGLDLIVIVMRNGLYGTIAMHQARQFRRTVGIDIGAVDIAGYARSMGARGASPTSAEELRDTLLGALDSGGVVVIDVVVDPDLISPGQRLSELLEPADTRSRRSADSGSV